MMDVIATSVLFCMTSVRVKWEPSTVRSAYTVSQSSPRERMIQSALVLIGQNGVEGTSFSQVIEHSGAPRGSIYHHFPGGKAQLVEEATRYAGDIVVNLAAAQLDADDPLSGLKSIGRFWRQVLHDSEFAAGCPVLAASLESRGLPGAREAASDSFERFQDVHFQLLQRAGIPDERARSLAATAVSAVEGAIILSRAQRSNVPLQRTLDEISILFDQAVDQARAEREATQ
jgi:TetR/AcrR family transcriptional repressor of lmrAB and yxaGH operons